APPSPGSTLWRGEWRSCRSARPRDAAPAPVPERLIAPLSVGGSGDSLFAHLDADLVAERRERCFEARQSRPGARVEQPRRFPVVNSEPPRQLGYRYSVLLQRFIQRRLQCNRGLRRDRIEAVSHRGRQWDFLAAMDASRQRLG